MGMVDKQPQGLSREAAIAKLRRELNLSGPEATVVSDAAKILGIDESVELPSLPNSTLAACLQRMFESDTQATAPSSRNATEILPARYLPATQMPSEMRCANGCGRLCTAALIHYAIPILWPAAFIDHFKRRQPGAVKDHYRDQFCSFTCQEAHAAAGHRPTCSRPSTPRIVPLPQETVKT